MSLLTQLEEYCKFTQVFAFYSYDPILCRWVADTKKGNERTFYLLDQRKLESLIKAAATDNKLDYEKKKKDLWEALDFVTSDAFLAGHEREFAEGIIYVPLQHVEDAAPVDVQYQRAIKLEGLNKDPHLQPQIIAINKRLFAADRKNLQLSIIKFLIAQYLEPSIVAEEKQDPPNKNDVKPANQILIEALAEKGRKQHPHSKILFHRLVLLDDAEIFQTLVSTIEGVKGNVAARPQPSGDMASHLKKLALAVNDAGDTILHLVADNKDFLVPLVRLFRPWARELSSMQGVGKLTVLARIIWVRHNSDNAKQILIALRGEAFDLKVGASLLDGNGNNTVSFLFSQSHHVDCYRDHIIILGEFLTDEVMVDLILQPNKNGLNALHLAVSNPEDKNGTHIQLANAILLKAEAKETGDSSSTGAEDEKAAMDPMERASFMTAKFSLTLYNRNCELNPLLLAITAGNIEKVKMVLAGVSAKPAVKMKLLSTVTGTILIPGVVGSTKYDLNALSAAHECYDKEIAEFIMQEIGYEACVMMVLEPTPKKAGLFSSQLKIHRPENMQKSVFSFVKKEQISGELMGAYYYFVAKSINGGNETDSYREEFNSFKEVLHNLLCSPDKRVTHNRFNKKGDYKDIEAAILDDKDLSTGKNKYVINFLDFLRRQMTTPKEGYQKVAEHILKFALEDKDIDPYIMCLIEFDDKKLVARLLKDGLFYQMLVNAPDNFFQLIRLRVSTLPKSLKDKLVLHRYSNGETIFHGIVRQKALTQERSSILKNCFGCVGQLLQDVIDESSKLNVLWLMIHHISQDRVGDLDLLCDLLGKQDFTNMAFKSSKVASDNKEYFYCNILFLLLSYKKNHNDRILAVINKMESILGMENMHRLAAQHDDRFRNALQRVNNFGEVSAAIKEKVGKYIEYRAEEKVGQQSPAAPNPPSEDAGAGEGREGVENNLSAAAEDGNQRPEGQPAPDSRLPGVLPNSNQRFFSPAPGAVVAVPPPPAPPNVKANSALPPTLPQSSSPPQIPPPG